MGLEITQKVYIERRMLRSESYKIPILNGCKEETFARTEITNRRKPRHIIKLMGGVSRRVVSSAKFC